MREEGYGYLPPGRSRRRLDWRDRRDMADLSSSMTGSMDAVEGLKGTVDAAIQS
jgi:hypothetical protein